MKLTPELVDAFAALVNGNTEKSADVNAYGTVSIVDGKVYVKMDGSDLLVPASTTVNVSGNERVRILMQNHEVTIVGNLTEPSGGATVEQGPKGDKGDPGEQGPKGDKGDPGDNSNWIINSNFAINQRGKSEYVRSGGVTGIYTVDLWYTTSNRITVTPVDAGVYVIINDTINTATHLLWQKFENLLPSGTYTLTVDVTRAIGNWAFRVRTVDSSNNYKDSYYTPVLQTGSNILTVTIPDGEYIQAVSLGISSSGAVAKDRIRLKSVKLENGSIATPYALPDPVTELLRCQRYFTIYKHQNATSNTDKCTIGVGYALTSSIVYAILPIATMRNGIAATVSYNGLSLISGADTIVDYTSVTVLEQTDSTVQVTFAVSGQTPGSVYRLRLMNSNAYLAVSKEL